MDVTTPYHILPAEKDAVWQLLSEVPDPEIPVLSILDLGIVREVSIHNDAVEIFITPTYSGCPAMDAISIDIKLKMISHGYPDVKVTSILSPAWTTEWMTEEGKRKLKAYGIAPPKQGSGIRIDKLLFNEEAGIVCPRCQSDNTILLSQFGSTACKALYQCRDCKEPFDYFKCH
jgi:ring-1,2-phenylacetyl-CoA epoxidase subunit PaaD